MRIVFVVLMLGLVFPVGSAGPTFAQRGDRGNKNQPEVWKQMDVPAAPVVPPDKALDTFKIAPGFKLELVAAEPLVEDPVAITWDEDGRLWAVEMRGYMPNVDGKGEDVRNGQIVVLEDVNGDGRMDKSTVFLGELQMPRAIALVKGGVLVAEPPTLWYCQDTDGDLKCDKKTAVHKSYARQGPVEHTDNGLRRHLDGWRYNAKSSKRLKFVIEDGQPKIIETQSIGRGQWGLSMDNYGRLYHNSNSSYLSADRMVTQYTAGNKNYDGKVGGGGSIASDQNVFSIRVNPGINRGYQPQMLDDKGRLRRTTATCGPGIYRGDQFPEGFVGDAFVPEPSGNVVSYFDMESRDDGSLRAHHKSFDDAKWGKREFLACTDERFRPINVETGPDGCLYIVDMYRGILQHKVYVTTFLRKQILERKLDKPIGLGRIYRVVSTAKPVNHTRPQMSKQKSVELVKFLAHPNGWWRDTAQRVLVDRGDLSIVGDLEEMATSHESHLARLHAMWTLHGLESLDYFAMAEAVQDAHVKVRVNAMRISEPLLQFVSADPNEQMDQQELIDGLMASIDHKNVEVQRQLALTFGQIKGPGVGQATRAMLLKHAGSGEVRAAVLNGLEGRELEFLQRLLADENWSKNDRGRDSFIRDLAKCVTREYNAHRIARLIGLASEQSGATAWRGKAMLDGVADVALGKGRRPKPIYYKTTPKGMLALAEHTDKSLREQAENIGQFIKWGAPPPPLPPLEPLTAAQQKRFEIGKTLYAKTCASCHLDSGLGEEGKAPPLLDSPWLLESKQRVIRIVLQGLSGEIEVHGRTYNMEMPPVQGLTDEQIAGLLTYARRSWEHRGDPVEPADVAKARAATKGRGAAWTAKELLKIKDD